jgi:hypothetical protein
LARIIFARGKCKTVCCQAADREVAAAKDASGDLSADKKETTMSQKLLAVVVLILVSAAAQAAPAKHRHVRTTDRVTGYEQWRNSNAYAAPSDSSALSDGAMASGIAGH